MRTNLTVIFLTQMSLLCICILGMTIMIFSIKKQKKINNSEFYFNNKDPPS